MTKKKIVKISAFWDLHIHGVAGIDFMHAKPQEMLQACEILGKQGIAAFCPTLLTSDPTLFEAACTRWGHFLNDLKTSDHQVFLSKTAAIPIGLHLEGPFLSHQMAGAHPKTSLKPPSLKYIQRLETISLNQISIVTLAPELKNSTQLITYLTKKKIRVQIGHTTAQSQDISRAIFAGSMGVTHLYNAMQIHHRNPGVLPFIHQKKLTAEIITDGIHLDLNFTHFLINSFPNQLYSVTDACSALCSKNGQYLTLGSLRLVKKDNCGVINSGIVKNSKILAGGATRMVDHPKLFKRLNPDESFFELFYKIPSQMFPKVAKLVRGRKNVFDQATWSFIRTEA